jgi:hypothetical protein
MSKIAPTTHMPAQQACWLPAEVILSLRRVTRHMVHLALPTHGHALRQAQVQRVSPMHDRITNTCCAELPPPPQLKTQHKHAQQLISMILWQTALPIGKCHSMLPVGIHTHPDIQCSRTLPPC